MIEIMVADIAKYDMVQIFEQAFAGEKVVLIHQGKSLNVLPNEKVLSEEERKLAILDNIFDNVQAKLPPNFKFDRDELYDR